MRLFRSQRWPLVCGAIVVALLVTQGLVRPELARRWLPSRGAEWIWASGVSAWSGPVAFALARDFELAQPPSQARLLAAADEEYTLYLNGTRVGSGNWRGPVLDAYEVAPLLVAGRNRLIAELRSSRGIGAFLAWLESDGEPPLRLGSDARWRTVHAWSAGLLPGHTPIRRRPLAVSLGLPPAGRWTEPREVVAKPLLADVAAAGGALPAKRWRIWEGGGGWRPLSRSRQGLGSAVVLDWGRVVTGYLSLQLSPGESEERAQAGLLYFGESLPEPGLQTPDAYLVPTPGRDSWQDVEVRRFRYAVVLGGPGVRSAQVHPVTAAGVTALLVGNRPESGVFGLPLSPSRPAIENEVWRQLQRVAGVAGGQAR